MQRGAASPADGAPPTEPALLGLKILVVDAEPDNRELMGRVLTDGGASVRLASSADEALAELDREPVDVLVSDIGMPGKDGYDLIRAVRSLPNPTKASVPAIALTAFAMKGDEEAMRAAGCDGYVTKPIRYREFLQELDNVVALSRRAAS
jgi:CheY-like chemotaxis protein